MSISPAVALTLLKLSANRRSFLSTKIANQFAAQALPAVPQTQPMSLQRTIPLSPIPQQVAAPAVARSFPATQPMSNIASMQEQAARAPAAPAAAAAGGANAASSNVQAAARSARRFARSPLARYGKLGLMGAGALGALGAAVGTVAYMNPSGMTGQTLKSGYESVQNNLRSTGNPFGRQLIPNVPAIAAVSDANPQEGAADFREQRARGKGTGIPTPQDRGFNFSPDPNVNDPYVRVGRTAGYALPNVGNFPAMPSSYNELKNTVIGHLGTGAVAAEDARRRDLAVPSIAQEATERVATGIREGVQNLGQQFNQYFNRR